MSGSVRSDETNLGGQLTWPRLLLLHLGPGAVAMGFTLAGAPLARRVGVPPDLALLAGSGVVAVAIRIGYLLHLGRTVSGGYSLRDVVGYRARLPAWRFLGLFGLGVALGLGLYFVLTPVSNFLATRAFGWLPFYLLPSWDPVHAGFGRGVLLVYLATQLIFNCLVAPVAEEMYFRGNLLPRMAPTKGPWAPVVSSALFAVQHFWQPFDAPFLFLFWLGFGPIIMRTRCLRLGIALHITSNVLGLAPVILALARL